jgi:ABC-type multidrug transport system fused ATPase/permease subunit
MSVMTMLAHVSAISVPLTAASNALSAAAILFTIIDAPKPSITGLKGVAVPMNQDLVLENINFAYPARHDVRILSGLVLRIPAGQMTAVVGSSGSGKSTIVALIQRWYDLGSTDPVGSYLRSGSIKIGDISLGSTDLHWWRSCIGLVQQEPFLFNDTIYKNVEYGLVGTQWEYAPERVKRQLVMRACREAYADEFVCTLPKVRCQVVTVQEILTDHIRAI